MPETLYHVRCDDLYWASTYWAGQADLATGYPLHDAMRIRDSLVKGMLLRRAGEINDTTYSPADVCIEYAVAHQPA